MADFRVRFDEYYWALYSWDLWDVAYLMMGGCSDDSFDYFRGWILDRGAESFNLAMADAEAFGLTVSRKTKPPTMQCEDILSAGGKAWTELTGEADPPRWDGRIDKLRPRGERFGVDPETLHRRFPRLAEQWGIQS